MISRRGFLLTTAAAVALVGTTAPALAATNRQYMAGGGFRPSYVNGTGTKQYFSSRIYVNDTQGGANGIKLPLLGVG